MTHQTKPRVTSFAPQFLVDDLERSVAYYQGLGFSFGEPWGGFYVIGSLDGFELHLKEAPRNRRSASIAGKTSTSTPRRASTVSSHSTNSVSLTARRSSSPWKRRRGAPRVSTLKILTAISSLSPVRLRNKTTSIAPQVNADVMFRSRYYVAVHVTEGGWSGLDSE